MPTMQNASPGLMPAQILRRRPTTPSGSTEAPGRQQNDLPGCAVLISDVSGEGAATVPGSVSCCDIGTFSQ